MNDVALREYIEKIIAEKELRRDDQLRAVNKALVLQAAEYERRLKVLNHAHEEARQVLHTYVAKAVYDQDWKTFLELKERVTIELADRTGKGKALPLVIALLSLGLSVFIAAATYLK